MNTDSPWIDFSTRQPQAIDWDDTHGVEVTDGHDRKTGYAMPMWTCSHKWTHWRRVELPPLPVKELSQNEKDDAELRKQFGHIGSINFSWITDGWLAALYYERSHLGMSAEQFVKELREISPPFSVYVRSKALNSAVEISWSKLQRLNDMLYRANKGNA